MIRVLHIVMGMNRGGLETFIMNIYRNIDRNKVQFDFLVHTDKNCEYDDEIRRLGGAIFHVIPRRISIIKNRNTLETFFKTHLEYNIIHQHVSSLSYVEPLKIARMHNVPVRIVHGHSTQEGGNSIHKYVHIYNQYFIKSYATHYFTCSDLAGKWMLGKTLYSKNKHKIINNGIDIKEFKYDKEIRKMIRERYDLADKFTIGHVGSFRYPKNHEFLIDIFYEILKDYPKSILMLIGEGDLRTSIEDKILKLGISENVILTGNKSNISELLQAMDVFVFPSHYEGLPVSLVEAQASGLPCIVSSTITQQVKITKNIEFVDIKSSSKLWAEKVINNKNQYIRRDCSEQVKNSGFDITVTAKELQCFYNSMIGLAKYEY